MANKRASLEEVAKNVLRKAKPSIDLGVGASDEVDEDQLEELKKEKNYKYKWTSRAWIAATNQEVKKNCYNFQTLDQLDRKKIVVLGVTLHTFLRGRHVQ